MWRRERIERVSIFRIDVVVHFFSYEDQDYGRNTGHAHSAFLCISVDNYKLGGCVCCVQR